MELSVIYLKFIRGYITCACTVLAYLFPLVGAALADGYWGKYKTIIRVSIIYILGMTINSISAIPFYPYQDGSFRTINSILCLSGLFIIAFGNGGIKSCLSSFGGDQFNPNDKKNTTTFFDLFYWSKGAGSLLATFVSPLLRQANCGPLGTQESCYFLGFFVPTVLMFFAVISILMGNNYKKGYRKVRPSGNNVFYLVCKAMVIGGYKRILCVF